MATSMVHGSIPKHLITFTIPTILGNIFQLTYNAMDSIIIGKYAGKESLAAIGTANPIMNIVTFLMIGICMGASVLMSEFYGAGDKEKLRHEISTTLIIGTVFTLFISIIGIAFAVPALYLIKTPPEIVYQAAQYLKIIFAGLIFSFLYNAYAATLRSVGDSVTPIIFLIISVIINGGLDLLFVVVFHWGIMGTAIATIIAQAVSAIACIIYAYIKIPFLRIGIKDFIIDKTLIFKTISYSWASAMQQTCLYVGKVVVQGAVNPLGVDSIATFNAVNRVDDFAFVPEQSISHSLTVLIAQNRGAKKEHRIKKAFWWAMLIETIYWVMLGTVTFFSSKNIMQLFVSEGDIGVINLGVTYIKIMSFAYIMPAITNVFQGYFRGMGKMQATLIATITQMVVRAICSYILAPSLGVSGIAYACIIGWAFMILFQVPAFIIIKKRGNLSND